MRALIFAVCLVMMGCGVDGGLAAQPPSEPCIEIAQDLAKSAQQLRSVSYEPSPEAVDETISLGLELGECLSERESL